MSLFDEDIQSQPRPLEDERDELLQEADRWSYGTLFNSLHNAVRGCLEILGCSITAIPVVAPITTSEVVLGAIIRAGGQPILVDLEEGPEFVQLSSQLLEGFLEELKAFIIVTDLPLPDLPGLEMCTIITVGGNKDNYLPTGENVVFNIIDYSRMECGAAVRTTFKEQREALRRIRSDFLGLDAMPSYHVLKAIDDFAYLSKEPYNDLTEIFTQGFPVVISNSYILISTKNKFARVRTALRDFGIFTEQAFLPKHALLKERFKEIPDYAGADELGPGILFISRETHLYPKLISQIADTLKKIYAED